jgi:hypothetical protein
MKITIIKMLRGNLEQWVIYLPVIQLSINDRIVGRHNSSLFSCMYARKMKTGERKEIEARTYSNTHDHNEES